MAKLSDIIEQFLLKTLGEEGEVDISRNELANFFSCAPSQINYVLDTRFTIDRGFLIESHRGGGGFANIKLGGKNTAVAGSFPVTDDQDIIMVTDGGKIIRTPVSDVRIAGRSTAGVTLFRTAENERVVSAISIEGASDEETSEESVVSE